MATGTIIKFLASIRFDPREYITGELGRALADPARHLRRRRVAHASFCDVCDLLVIRLECGGAPALRGAMIAYVPNGGMYAPPSTIDI
jgi:hypothetical protein